MKQLKGQRYGIWSMDLHPDAEIASGMFRKGGLLARGLHALNDAGYRNADFVVDLGRHMKRRLMDRGLSSEKLHTIPVWGKEEDIEPIPHDENPLRAELGLEDKFVVMYSGNAGVAHRFDEVLALMKQLDGHPHIRFVFVGEGPQKERIEAFAEDEGLSNFQYLPYFPREDLKYSLSLADVHLLTLREAMAGIAVPGKLYGIMAAGRPVLMVGPEASESAETIRECEAGRVVDPSEHDRRDACVETLRNALFSLYSQKRYRQELGRRGREAFLAEYERDVACEEWSHLLQDVVRAKRRKESRVQTAAAG
jgi:glycosyltransferase involved in cell wall biosynthesis